MKDQKITRRTFIRTSALAAGALSVAPMEVLARDNKDITKQWNSRKKSGFTVWQIPSHKNNIGNSYVFRTTGGKVIVMDGGTPEEEFCLRGFIGALGNEVEAWFISHPHSDHMGALSAILADPQDLKIKMICHSRLPEAVIKCDGEAPLCRTFYSRLEAFDGEVIDMQEPGRIFTFDDMSLKILSVANDFTNNAYNNSSMIMRVWDRRKSLVFLGDAGVECGRKVLDGPFRSDLDCEYLQMAHHGQNGCDEAFYRSIRFRACLWPTPMWVWNNDTGNGFNTAHLHTVETRGWMDALGITEHHVSVRDGLWRLD